MQHSSWYFCLFVSLSVLTGCAKNAQTTLMQSSGTQSKSNITGEHAIVFAPDYAPAVLSPSVNQNSRIRYVVIHYTAGNWQRSWQALTQPSNRPVSSHYLIPASNDPSYPAEQPFQVHQLVSEQQRAWHAGHSQWGERTHLNDQSIGIELVNQSHCELRLDGTENCYFEPFDPMQLQLLADLLADIRRRYPTITPDRILAHSDISPLHKQDPGPHFPWRWLAEQDLAAWYDHDTFLVFWHHPRLDPAAIAQWQQALRIYGYGITETGIIDETTQAVLIAFQRRFVPDHIDGLPNRKTLAVLSALLIKYRPETRFTIEHLN